MDQKWLLFQPHILVVPVGSTVEFLNSDKVQHNIFWPAISGNKKLSHNMGTWPTGEKRAFKFDTAGRRAAAVQRASGDVGLHHRDSDSVSTRRPTPSGNFKIANVPDGSYTVTAWHEGLKTQSKPVTVAGDATVDFTLVQVSRRCREREAIMLMRFRGQEGRPGMAEHATSRA